MSPLASDVARALGHCVFDLVHTAVELQAEPDEELSPEFPPDYVFVSEKASSSRIRK